ncbi:hypothetical protein ACFVYP_07955 [Kitasatospora sp. NPDC058201]|uniref:hypothetical protein n=1 Tax=Streptomycetaceae TaxID=2062 RepID=UPI002E7723AE|nr:hypothetical protein [Streptomyces sp. BE303]MED7954755.1 hypothetical protein [Streptomyces sp. BE303]
MSRDETAGLRAAQLRLGRLPGYVRRPDPARRSGEQGHTYKKGWEVRFTARSEAEIAEIRDLVVAAGFAPARPFFKGHQLIQPVYGMAAVQAYLAARQAAEEHAARAVHGRGRRGTDGTDHEAVHEPGGAVCEAPGPAHDAAAGAVDVSGGHGGHGNAIGRADRGRLEAAGAAAAAAEAAAASAARLARRRVVETFPAQLERSTAADARVAAAETRQPY